MVGEDGISYRRSPGMLSGPAGRWTGEVMSQPWNAHQ